MEKHAEIEKGLNCLKKWRDEFDMELRTLPGAGLAGREDFPPVSLRLGKELFWLYVDDEYADLHHKQPLLNICLLLRSLEDYAYAGSHALWCRHHLFDENDPEIRSYFLRLGRIYERVLQVSGRVNSCISDYDFELNTGAARMLRESSVTL